MCRLAVTILLIVLSMFDVAGYESNAVVVDATTRLPLPRASIFDKNGNAVGLSGVNGELPYISADSYPVTVRYVGFKEKSVPEADADTIFLEEIVAELPEIVVESRRKKVMHVLAYVREYSTMTTYSDTVFLFREKMVDYMLTPDRKMKFRGWINPRLLKSKSYYRFTNSQGLDSVSDESNYHFSWSDWVGIAPGIGLPEGLCGVECGSDTLTGQYSPAEIWMKNDDRVIVDVDVLAAGAARKWVPGLAAFFRDELDFDEFKMHFKYDNVAEDSITPMNLTGYSYNIDSRGRGHDNFRFNRIDEAFFVNTYAEVYIIDKEYITVKEAKKWADWKVSIDGMIEPPEMTELHSNIKELVDRVENIDKDKIRLEQIPDHRLAGNNAGNRNFSFGRRALFLLKQLTGIGAYRANKNMKRQWDDFRNRRP